MKTTISFLYETVTPILLLIAMAGLLFCSPQPKAPPGGTYCADVGADAARVETAFGSILRLKDEAGNPRPATTTEIEASIFDWLEGRTRDYEDQQHAATFTPPPFSNAKKYSLTPTPSPKK